MRINLHRACAAAVVAVGLTLTVPAAAQERPAAAQPPAAAPLQPGLLPEPHFISRSIDFANRTIKVGDGVEHRNGFYPEMGNMVPGSGWIASMSTVPKSSPVGLESSAGCVRAG